MAGWLADQMNTISYEVLYEGPLGEKYKELMKNYNVPGKPFVWQVRTSLHNEDSCMRPYVHANRITLLHFKIAQPCLITSYILSVPLKMF